MTEDSPKNWLESPTVLPSALDDVEFSRLIDDPELPLDARLRLRLKEQNMTRLFPCQTALLSHCCSSSNAPIFSPSKHPGDILVSAPTGSGKTLAYALPILNSLLAQQTYQRAHFLRALILLPTRDLVMQVKKVMDTLSQKSGLSIVAIVGGGRVEKSNSSEGSAQSTGLAKEQDMLFECYTDILSGEPRYKSRCDVLITTPGRLVDQLKTTNGLSLKHLQWLVLDEADRLLDQSFNDWLAMVLGSINNAVDLDASVRAWDQYSCDETLALMDRYGFDPLLSHAKLSPAPVVHLRKMLFSATLTRHPGKISSLRLNNPRLFVTSSASPENGNADPDHRNEDDEAFQQYVLPDTLKQHYFVAPSAGEKPLYLLYLLQTVQVHAALCFTNSIEHAERLHELLTCFNEQDPENKITVGYYASTLSSSQRIKLLRQFKNGAIRILICTDALARGIDVSEFDQAQEDGESFLTVIHYDMPTSTATYVHRSGRTARAGRTGKSFALLVRHEARYWKDTMKKHGFMDKMRKCKIEQPEVLENLTERYETALKSMRESRHT